MPKKTRQRKFRTKMSFKLLYVGTEKQMRKLKKSKGQFLPRKNYSIKPLPKSQRKYGKSFGLFRKKK